VNLVIQCFVSCRRTAKRSRVAERDFGKNLAKMVSTEVARRTLLMNVSAYGDHWWVIGSAHQILAAEVAAGEMGPEDFLLGLGTNSHSASRRPGYPAGYRTYSSIQL
jgi:hypothetical protein